MKPVLILAMALSSLISFSQERESLRKPSSGVHELNWVTSRVNRDPEKTERILTFQGAVYPSEYNLNPAFNFSREAPLNAGSATVVLINDLWTPLSNEEAALIDVSVLSDQAQIKSAVATAKKKKYLQGTILPFRRTSSGNIEKLVSFDLSIDYQTGQPKSAPAVFASTSVLSTGTWFKIGVAADGIYKVTYQDLVKLGISPSSLNLSAIGLYGQPGGMLYELNALPKKDDLKELDIYIEGENDGVFNQNDYLLFYGESASQWELKNTGFTFKRNCYSDTTYYFLTTDRGTGKRVGLAPTVTATPTHYVTSFNDFKRHESESSNFLKSGRRWFGERFEINTVQDFPFFFKNIVPGSSTEIKVCVAHRGQNNGQFTININGNSYPISTIAVNFSATYDDFAKENTGTFNLTGLPSTFQVGVNYLKDANSVGWLDYIEANARRQLIYSNEPLLFRDISSAGPGNVAQFTIQNSTPNLFLWNVTDPVKPTSFLLSSGTFRNYSDTVKTYILFNPNDAATVQLFGAVANQNLHALPQTEMLIVVHPKFQNQAHALADIHKQEGLSVEVVTTNQVYNEFSAGSADASAIRDFMKMFYDRAGNPSELPKYLLLFGDGSFDNKGRAANISNYIPTWQSEESLHPINSIVSDDYFGLLDDNEGLMTFDKLDIAIGRFPVSNTTEALALVEKIRHYTHPATMRPWRNKILFVADDENNSEWIKNSEILYNSINTSHPEYNYDKIYIDAYRQEYTPGGQRYPEAKDAFVRGVQTGSLIMNYIGHGGETGLAHEQILTISDINSWTNLNSLPLFFTATCEFSRFDDHTRTSAGEYVFLNPKGGGIGLMTTVRVVYGSGNQNVNEEFFKHALNSDTGSVPTMGDIYYLTKSPFNDANSRSFTLLGDPAVKLAYPKDNVAALTINNLSVTTVKDTLKALAKVTVTGELRDLSGQKMTSFNGILYPTVYDKKSQIKTLSNDGSGPNQSPQWTFDMWKNVIYKGKASVKDGSFSFTFIVPKDISYDYGIGRISFYAEDGTSDANGFTHDFYVGGTDTTAASDETGPRANLYMNDTKFIFGGLTDENPNLLGILFDEHGINTSGTGIGHDITAILDENTSKTIVLNDFYEADLDSYQSGKVIYPFNELEEGRHTLRLKAWDVYNNSSEAYTEFVVAKSSKIALEHVLNYPNPFTTYTEFWFEHNQPVSGLDVQIQIFTVSGKLVKTLEAYVNTEGYRAEPIPWDGRDEFGDRIGRGVYVYRLKVRGDDGTWADKIEKLVILQ